MVSKNREAAIEIAQGLEEEGKIVITRSKVKELTKSEYDIEKFRLEHIEEGFNQAGWECINMNQSAGDMVYISRDALSETLRDNDIGQ